MRDSTRLASWLIGALRSFDAGNTEFMSRTIGQAPIRFGLVLGVIYGCVQFGGFDGGPLAVSLIVTMVCGHLLEAWVFNALGKATG